MGSYIERGTSKLLFRLACGPLSLGLLALMSGCGQNIHSVEHTEVSGKVLFQGKPLSGGRVNFITVQGAFASSGKIDENGQYQLKAPVGDVRISVMNQKLPPQYQNPETSGLKYTVRPGPQTHDIEISTTSSPAAGASGQ